MQCSELVQLVTDYLEGALPSRKRQNFEEHLAGCAGCRAYVEQTRQAVNMLGTATPEPVDDDLCADLLDLFKEVHRSPK
jgi:predicted anti-sigma-YlaC factor YlaD